MYVPWRRTSIPQSSSLSSSSLVLTERRSQSVVALAPHTFIPCWIHSSLVESHSHSHSQHHGSIISWRRSLQQHAQKHLQLPSRWIYHRNQGMDLTGSHRSSEERRWLTRCLPGGVLPAERLRRLLFDWSEPLPPAVGDVVDHVVVQFFRGWVGNDHDHPPSCPTPGPSTEQWLTALEFWCLFR